MADDDLIYLLRRAADEHNRAERATDPGAKAAHDALAEGYHARIRAHGAGKIALFRH